MGTVTLSSAEQALKTVYLGVVSDQLNLNTNPLYAKITKTTEDVWGKEVRKAAPVGINGGFGAGSETSNLPRANGTKYAQFTSGLKNLYGQIEISDKAVRASAGSAGAMVNLLNAELDGLLKASKFNLGRMLFGDGSGKLCVLDRNSLVADTERGRFTFRVKEGNINNVAEGMLVDTYAAGILTLTGTRVLSVDRNAGAITISEFGGGAADIYLYVQGSRDNELTGLGAIFDPSVTTLYGLSKADNPWLLPTSAEMQDGDDLECKMQSVIDKVSDQYGSEIDLIICNAGVKRAFMKVMNAYKRNIDVMNIEGGYKAMSFNGVPVVGDRFAPAGTMYFLNTRDFKMHQLCDWKWLEGNNGKILRQVPGKPVYTAALVKYAELVCDKPGGQARLTGIAEA